MLENIAYARAHNSEQQMDLLKMASAMMAEDRYVKERENATVLRYHVLQPQLSLERVAPVLIGVTPCLLLP